jgi:hypothetical protein
MGRDADVQHHLYGVHEVRQSTDRMRGVAWAFDGAAIEFGSEPEKYFSKIVYERLPPARQCGVSAAKGQKA